MMDKALAGTSRLTRAASLGTLVFVASIAHAQVSKDGFAHLGTLGDSIESPDADRPDVERFMQGQAWTPLPADSAVVLTFSFAPDVDFDNNILTQDPPYQLLDNDGAAIGPNTLFSRLDFLFGEGLEDTDPAFLGGRAAWRDAIVSVITNSDDTLDDSWGEVSGIQFIQVFRTNTNPGIEDDDTNFNFWDDGTAWHTEALFTNPGLTDTFGDIRIGMAPLGTLEGQDPFIVTGSNAQTTDARAGHIILDSTRDWAQGSDFRFLRNAMRSAIGQSLGLLPSCPQTGDTAGQDSVLEPGVLLTGNDVMQNEDIRAVQSLYGDANEPDESTSTQIVNNFGNPFTPESDDVFLVNLSIDSPKPDENTDSDQDFYTFFGADTTSRFTFTIVPQFGAQSLSTDTVDMFGACDPTNVQTIDTTALQDLRVTLFPPPPTPMDPMPAPIVFNESPAGENEVVVRQIAPDQIGQWTLMIDSATISTAVPAEILQSYALLIQGARDNTPDIRDQFSRFLNDGERLAIGMWSTLGLRDDPATPENEPADVGFSNDFNASDPLERSYVGVLDFFRPNLNHDVFDPMERPRPNPMAIWGQSFANPAQVSGALSGNELMEFMDNPNTHATATAAVIGGAEISMPVIGDSELVEFEGVSPEANLAFGSLSQAVIPSADFGLIGLEATYYALFGMTDPTIATQDIGLQAPVSIINGSFGNGATSSYPFITGDGEIAIAIDALVSMRDVTVVLAAGNDGGTDQRPACSPGAGQDDPGVQFVGSRTITNPATCFNAIVVGSVASQFDTMEMMAMGDDNGDGFVDEIREVPTFSAKGPIDSADFSTGSPPLTEPMLDIDARSGIHILAPGIGAIARNDLGANADCFPGKIVVESLGLPSLGDDGLSTSEFAANNGTSFSTAIVTGAVALMQDYNTLRISQERAAIEADFAVEIAEGTIDDADVDSMLTAAVHDIDVINSPLLMKACIINSGSKLEGWSNNNEPGFPQDEVDGSMEMSMNPNDPDLHDDRSDQPLDFAQGSGWLDFSLLFEQFVGLDENAITRGVFETRSNRAVVTRIAQGPVIMASEDPAQDHASEFPPLDQRGPSPFEVRDTLANMEMSNSDLHEFRPAQDIGDINFGSGGGGVVVPFNTTVPVTGPGRGENGIPPVIPGPNDPMGDFTPGPGQQPVRLNNPIVVEKDGWDIGMVGSRIPSGEADRIGYVDYLIPNIQPGEVITATLVWNRRVTIETPNFNNPNPVVGNELLEELELENLDLTLFASNDLGDAGLIQAESNSTFNNVEHLTDLPFVTPGGQSFILRVEWIEQEYDFFRNGEAADVQYALAWRVTANEDLEDDGTIFVPTAPGLSASTGGTAFGELLDLIGSFGSRVHYDSSYSKRADTNKDGRINFTDLIAMLGRM